MKLRSVMMAGKALELALNEDWNAILLDLMLPGLNGLEVCRRDSPGENDPRLL